MAENRKDTPSQQSREGLIAGHKSVQPLMAVECTVPWDVIRKLGLRKKQDFYGPFTVFDNQKLLSNELFNICFNYTVEGIEILLRLKQENRTKLLHIVATLRLTKRDPGDKSFHQDPRTWPLPDNLCKQFSVKTKDEVICMTKLVAATTRSFTLRLQVYTYKLVSEDSIGDFLNSTREIDSPLCDVKLQVNGQLFPAHKAVLCANSCVFMAMFTGGFKENSTSSVVTIEGVSQEAFGMFLNFLYTMRLETSTLTGTSILELLDLSERYQVAQLKARCEMILWSLEALSALWVLMAAPKWPVVTPAIQNRLYQLVAADWRSIADSVQWRALQDSNPVAAGIIETFAPYVAPPSVKYFNAQVPLEKISRKRPATP